MSRLAMPVAKTSGLQLVLLGDLRVVLEVSPLALLLVLADQPELGHEFALNEPNQAFAVAAKEYEKT